jgi:hypothetical protein
MQKTKKTRKIKLGDRKTRKKQKTKTTRIPLKAKSFREH